MTWTQNQEHVSEALDHIAGPFQVPDVEALLEVLAEQVQELEGAVWQVYDSRFLENATGRSLEIVGAMSGEEDLGDGEASFKLRIRLKLRAVHSRKRYEDFVELLALIPDTRWRVGEIPGWVIVTQLSGAGVPTSALYRFLQIASADGVLVKLTASESADDPFTWPSFDGTIEGSAWGSFDGTIEGAPWQGVRQ